MKNKIEVNIGGTNYTLVADEDEAYVRKLAAHADEQIRAIRKGSSYSFSESAVLACVNMADEYFKLKDEADSLRQKIKEYADENADLNLQLSKTRQENYRLQNQAQSQKPHEPRGGSSGRGK